MSASPTDRPSTQTLDGGRPPLIRRRPKDADPMVRKKVRKPIPKPPLINGMSTPYANGLKTPGQGEPQGIPEHLGKPPLPSSLQATSSILAGSDTATSGFSSPPIAPYRDYPLVTTKRALMEGMRYHVARFSSKRPVDPRDESDFIRPVRLHRRDPRAPLAGKGYKEDDISTGGIDSLDDKERENQEILKAERIAQREVEMAQVAPAANTAKKLGAFKKKTQQVFRTDRTEQQKAVYQLRYEETLPWHLEDFENKNTWVGSYEAALSDTHVMLVQEGDVFRMVPVEKWYKFTPKNHFKTMTIEEAEKSMNKKMKDPRWFMESQKANEDKQTEQMNKKASSKLFIGKWERGEVDTAAAVVTKHEHVDADDLDFEEDFADDEEGAKVDVEDEETKHAEERIKRDQLQANIFDLKEETEYDKQAQIEKEEKEQEKTVGKRVRKALMKREKNYIYDSDSDENPYSEASQSEDSETERLKEEEQKKDEEKIGSSSEKEKGKLKVPSSQSGSLSKGTNTPSDRHVKHSHLKKPTSSTLKRPGSPHLSEASGTDTSHKKQKKYRPSPQPSGTSTPLKPLSRPMSPVNAPISNANRSSNISHQLSVPQDPSRSFSASIRPDGKRPRTGADSGSEREGAGSGGEMSDGTKRKKLKLTVKKPPGQNGSPEDSRTGSPVPADGGAVSPVLPEENAGPLPSLAEVKARIPPQGITVPELLAFFPRQVVGQERKVMFTQLMRKVSTYDKKTKLLSPL